MTSPGGGERLTFVLDTAGGPQVVSELQRIGQTGETAQNRIGTATKATTGTMTQQASQGTAAQAQIAQGVARSTTGIDRMSQRLGVSSDLLRTGLATAAAVGFGVLVSKIGDAVESYVDLAGEVRDFQRVSGATAEESSRLVAVFDDLQISADTASTAVGKLARVDPSKLAAFGIEVAHASDGTTDLVGTLLNVADAYAATTDPAERAQLGAAAFGKSYQDLIPLLEQGRAGLESYFAGVNEGQVYSQEALDQAKAYELALDGLQDALGEAGQAAGRTLVPALTTLLDIGTEVLGWLEDIPTPLLQAAVGAAAFGIAAGKIGPALSALRSAGAVEALTSTAAASSAAGAAADAAEKPVGRFGRAMGGLRSAAGIGAVIGASIPFLTEAADAIRSLAVQDRDVDRLSTSLLHLAASGEAAGALGDQGGIDGFTDSLSGLLQLRGQTDGFLGTLGEWVGPGGGLTGLSEGLSQNAEDVSAVDEALADLVSSGDPEAAAEAFQRLTEQAREQGIPIETLRALFPQYAEAVTDADLAQQDAAASGEDLGGAATATKGAVEEAADAVDGFRQQLELMRGGQVDLAEADIASRDALANFATQVHDAAAAGDEYATSLDRSTQTGRDNESALIDQVRAAEDYAAAVLEQTGSQDAASRAYAEQITAIRDNAVAVGLNRAEVEALLDRYGAVPDKIKTVVDAEDLASEKLAGVKDKLDKLNGKRASVEVIASLLGTAVKGVGGKASGGAVASGTDYIVGEVRPEWFRPAVPGTIVPNTAGAGSSGAAGRSQTVNVTVDRDSDRITRAVLAALADDEFLAGAR